MRTQAAVVTAAVRSSCVKSIIAAAACRWTSFPFAQINEAAAASLNGLMIKPVLHM